MTSQKKEKAATKTSPVTMSYVMGTMRVDLVETNDGSSAILTDNGSTVGFITPEEDHLALTLFPDAKLSMTKNPIDSMNTAMVYAADALRVEKSDVVVKNENDNPEVASIVNTMQYMKAHPKVA